MARSIRARINGCEPETANARRRLHRTDRKAAARLKSYLALIGLDLRLALRQKSVIFFNYLFPLIFLIVFAQFTKGDSSGAAMARILTLVIIIGVLGNGLFGAGIRA